MKIYANKSTTTNNVKRICNHLQWSRFRDMTPTTHGYRCCIGKGWAEDELQELINDIRDNLGINCTYRVRGGYGVLSGVYDLIIPYANDDEELVYQYR